LFDTFSGVDQPEGRVVGVPGTFGVLMAPALAAAVDLF
jgi:hypothetical protein